jgi:hypothetical protein
VRTTKRILGNEFTRLEAGWWSRRVCGLILTIAATNISLPAQTTSAGQDDGFPQRVSWRTPVRRVVLPVHSTRTVLFDEEIISVIVIDPETVTVTIDAKNARLLSFTGLREGDSIVIVALRSGRQTLAIDVKPLPGKTPEQIAAAAARRQRALRGPSGIYSLSFTPAFGGGPALVRQSFNYNRKLSEDRTLRISTDLFKFLAGGERGLTSDSLTNLGLDRITLSVDSPTTKLELLDSDLMLSPLSFNGYAMRGIHFTSTIDSRLRGLEFFAGQARSSLVLFDNKHGYIGGAIVPVVRGTSWQLRAGLMAVSSRSDVAARRVGLIWNVDWRYFPDARTNAEAEVAFASGAVSWRTRIDLKRGAFNISGESLRFDHRSPLVQIGAPSSGRTMDAASVGWQPSARLAAQVSYSRGSSIFLQGSQRATLKNANLFASVNYNLSSDSLIGVRFSEQAIETSSLGFAHLLRLGTRNVAITHNLRFGEHWRNDLEAGFTSTNESKAGTRFAQGVNVRDELRRTWGRWSATAYLNYTRNTPSLASLVARNPNLLPTPLRSAFEADPSRFLVLNRDLLPVLLGGILLPDVRSLDVGVRLQGGFSRYTLTSDVRYGSGEILAREQKSLLATVNANVRLDPANYVQLSAARLFAGQCACGQSTLTISYVHRFGAGTQGFQFSNLLGLDRGTVEGRVFFDVNTNGLDDPGEPGIAGMKIQLDPNRSAMTDNLGRYRFSSINSGDYSLALVSKELGLSLRASTPTERELSVVSRQTTRVSFGVTNYASVSGRVFNDLSLGGANASVTNAPGVAGVRINLRRERVSDPPVTATVDASGIYEFHNVAPGPYILELDPSTLPADFRMPTQMSSRIEVKPLKNFYFDIPLTAQRAITGTVFVDRDGDGRFDEAKDEPIEGARVASEVSETVTDRQGRYFLRNLPAGKVEVRVYLQSGERRGATIVELTATPAILRAVNLAVRP